MSRAWDRLEFMASNSFSNHGTIYVLTMATLEWNSA